MAETWLGVDIGGANIKLSTAAGESLAFSFPIWLESDRLESALSAAIERLLRQCGDASRGHLAVTMTGELADCFETRRQGVAHILEHVERACGGWNVCVYSVDGTFLDPTSARERPWDVAASNWHALGSWLATSDMMCPAAAGELSILVDVGSTTVDIIPLNERGVATEARTDRQRLQRGQLVYTGMERTPVAAIAQGLKLSSGWCPLMAERFATSDDAYLVLGLVAETPTSLDTADGKPRTRDFARSRLARMVGEDAETLAAEEIESMAEQVIGAQAGQILRAIELNHARYSRPDCQGLRLVLTGHGRPLLERVLAQMADVSIRWLDELTDAEGSRCAPARAVACLLKMRTQSPRTSSN